MTWWGDLGLGGQQTDNIVSAKLTLILTCEFIVCTSYELQNSFVYVVFYLCLWSVNASETARNHQGHYFYFYYICFTTDHDTHSDFRNVKT